MNTRRIFLRNSALAMVGAGSAPLWLQRALYAGEAPAPRKKILVAIFQRGAADGLNVVVPHGEKAYYNLRPTIAVGRPSTASDKRDDAAIDLDGFFGLHPSLAPLKPLYDGQHLAIVDAAGSPDPTRSHFDAQDYMESGTPGLKATNDGWMNRALPKAPGNSSAGPKVSPVRAVSLGPVLPRAMRGAQPAIALQSIAGFQVPNAEAARQFQEMYTNARDPVLRATGRETFEAVSMLQSILNQAYTPAGGAQYPRGRFGDNLRQIAQLIKAEVGVEMAFADIGGWDHHVNEIGARASEGQLANLLREFGQALAAFWQDMGDRMQDVVVVTMSEFGRTARENGNRGTDHGHANNMFVMGGAVKGGKVYGKWPGLEPEQLYEGRDLALTTDFRDVLGELVARHMGTPSVKGVFPGYDPKFLGLV
ncbi:MAG TPA: DUF1501 domain-containing protein [Candidatus Acidoferrales bacterium]|jgi:uncharacterized protein (DUF1501 family)|nr:DUF1501 domain-containing protein [Candidatus Acidoferrales bacterium]